MRCPVVFSFLLLASVLHAEPLFTFPFTGSPGPYTVEQWKKDWPGCEYEDGLAEGHGELVTREGSSWLRVLYPKGSVGADQGGAGWRFPFGQHEAAELRYTVRFDEGFEFVKGGKLPGLCGGPKTITGGDAVNGLDGFSARVMWRKDGRGQAYVYHMHQPSKYGDEFDFPEDFRFVPGKPVTLRMQVEMNAAGKKNGQLRIWADDKLMVEKTDLQWRKGTTYGVDSILFNTFHGGSGAEWAPSHDVHAEFTGFQVQVKR
jgi:hypothetical protein